MNELRESDLLRYLVVKKVKPGDRLPPLPDLSQEIGISTGKLREQLEVARTFGFVSVQPRLGTRREEFDFYPAVHTSLLFGLTAGEATFDQFSQFRQNIESSMWSEAVNRLLPQDKEQLETLVSEAWRKLRGSPIHIPNGEHRQLHLTIFSRLDNPFVQALLTAYWDAYELSELTRFAEYQYWIDVWNYHERIVEAIKQNRINEGQRLLVEHFQLLPAPAMQIKPAS